MMDYRKAAAFALVVAVAGGAPGDDPPGCKALMDAYYAAGEVLKAARERAYDAAEPRYRAALDGRRPERARTALAAIDAWRDYYAAWNDYEAAVSRAPDELPPSDANPEQKRYDWGAAVGEAYRTRMVATGDAHWAAYEAAEAAANAIVGMKEGALDDACVAVAACRDATAARDAARLACDKHPACAEYAQSIDAIDDAVRAFNDCVARNRDEVGNPRYCQSEDAAIEAASLAHDEAVLWHLSGADACVAVAACRDAGAARDAARLACDGYALCRDAAQTVAAREAAKDDALRALHECWARHTDCESEQAALDDARHAAWAAADDAFWAFDTAIRAAANDDAYDAAVAAHEVFNAWLDAVASASDAANEAIGVVQEAGNAWDRARDAWHQARYAAWRAAYDALVASGNDACERDAACRATWEAYEAAEAAYERREAAIHDAQAVLDAAEAVLHAAETAWLKADDAAIEAGLECDQDVNCRAAAAEYEAARADADAAGEAVQAVMEADPDGLCERDAACKAAHDAYRAALAAREAHEAALAAHEAAAAPHRAAIAAAWEAVLAAWDALNGIAGGMDILNAICERNPSCKAAYDEAVALRDALDALDGSMDGAWICVH